MALCGNVKWLDVKGGCNTYRGDRSVDLTDTRRIALISNGNGQSMKFTNEIWLTMQIIVRSGKEKIVWH